MTNELHDSSRSTHTTMCSKSEPNLIAIALAGISKPITANTVIKWMWPTDESHVHCRCALDSLRLSPQLGCLHTCRNWCQLPPHQTAHYIAIYHQKTIHYHIFLFACHHTDFIFLHSVTAILQQWLLYKHLHLVGNSSTRLLFIMKNRADKLQKHK